MPLSKLPSSTPSSPKLHSSKLSHLILPYCSMISLRMPLSTLPPSRLPPRGFLLQGSATQPCLASMSPFRTPMFSLCLDPLPMCCSRVVSDIEQADIHGNKLNILSSESRTVRSESFAAEASTRPAQRRGSQNPLTWAKCSSSTSTRAKRSRMSWHGSLCFCWDATLFGFVWGGSGFCVPWLI